MLTASGYFREYEVKLTVADFRADAKKYRTSRAPWDGRPTQDYEKKHDLLAAGHVHGPAEFYFVTPAGMITQIDLPIWAGWIELHNKATSQRPAAWWVPQTVVPAPKLHRQKANPEIRDHALGSCYYRYHDLLRSRGGELPPAAVDAQPPGVDGPTAADAPSPPQPGEVLLASPLGTQLLGCGNRVPVENPVTIRVQP